MFQWILSKTNDKKAVGCLDTFRFAFSYKEIIMGATSVTGVGPGSAESMCKGAAGRMTLSVEHLIGPHIVAAGSVTLSGGAAAVHIPLLPNAVGTYIVLVTDQTANHSCYGSIALGTDTTITLAGTSTDVLGWAIVSIGLSAIDANDA